MYFGWWAFRVIFAFLVLNLIPVLGSPRTCLISGYVSNPKNATVGIQRALRDCGDCGGTVVFDGSGIFISGALVASGSVRIILPPKITLAASELQADYPGPKSDWYLLRFQNCTGCTLGGGGTLDGQARLWVNGTAPGRKTVRNFHHRSCSYKPEECRPRLLGVVDSSGVAVHNITIVDPIYWAVHVLGSSDVMLTGLNITGDWEIPNNDGIDIDSSIDVAVHRCWVDTADDAICLKTTRPEPTERIKITNCTLRSRSSAFKVGSESVGDFSRIVVTDLVIRDANRGLAIQLRDQGSVRDVVFSRIRMTVRHMHPSWWGAAEPIYITSVPRFLNQSSAEKKQKSRVGLIDGVEISDVTAWAENGIFIAGTEIGDSVTVRRVAVRNMRLGMKKLSNWTGGQQDYRPSTRGLVETGKTAAVWVEGAEHVVVEGLKVRYYSPRRKDWKEVVHIDETSTKDVLLRGCEFRNVTGCIGVGRSAGALGDGDGGIIMGQEDQMGQINHNIEISDI